MDDFQKYLANEVRRIVSEWKDPDMLRAAVVVLTSVQETYQNFKEEGHLY